MSLNWARARQLLADGDLRRLFVDALGWDRYTTPLDMTTDGSILTLPALAHKRGMVAYRYTTSSAQPLPDYAQRRKIEHQIAKAVHEHLIVFTDAANQAQIWQWVKREPGKPAACREHSFHRSQPGDALLQKLERITFTLEEEEALSLPGVTGRARAAFDVERVTRRFYDRFQEEHRAFLSFVEGITEQGDREWYASVMLNRLMFVYFIQRKGFLDGGRDYLRKRLNLMRTEHGRDKFYSFYRYFVLRLFHEGLGGRKRTSELEKLLGHIPFLNGGLFDVHELERRDRYGENIQIPDQAFERIFDYFDRYQWHLDERPLRDDNEINPDVLGYIFEKDINQKQMGAYYTKEDITEYISKNTVVPFLFDAARAKCKVAFENPKGPTVWDILKDDPDRYIYEPVRHGVTWNYIPRDPNQGEPLAYPLELPPDIAAGLNPSTLQQPVSDGPVQTLELRNGWNKTAPGEYGLPTEIWREVVARRTRYGKIKAKLAAGEVHDINDLITFNLDIRQFAQDVIENCEGPELLRAFWHTIEKISILDPTCGSGAFLFAALNILEPLYEACLERMQAFVEDLERSGEKPGPEKFSDFRKVLANVAAHPNRRYFILKNIILYNLFGVDIMEEAVEICKLRLFLKLAAQVDPDMKGKNLGIEPLPDIDFNIRAGNTLVGYATYVEVLKQAEGDWVREQAIGSIKITAADLQQAFDAFRARQIEGDDSVPTEDKQELRRRLNALDDELNRYLASECGIGPSKKDAYANWLKSHQPFHWFVEFYGIMSSGGFDVIIGNPPWKEYAAVRGDYTIRNYCVERSGNLYALCSERSLQLIAPHGYFSFIVQLPLVSSSRMVSLRQHLIEQCSYLNLIPCDDRPGKLFDGLQNCRSCIFVARKRRMQEGVEVLTTRYNRWVSEVRETLFNTLEFTQVADVCLLQGQFPKLGGSTHAAVFKKIFACHTSPVRLLLAPHSTDQFIFYQEATRYWVKATVGLPFYAKNGKVGAPAHGRYLFFRDVETTHVVCAILNSSLFYSYFIAHGDCFHLSDTLATVFPLSPHVFGDKSLVKLNEKLMADLRRHAQSKTIATKDGDQISYAEFNVSESKPILDEIDQVMARHYGFTEEELDFIIKYDIKYRMGGDA